MITKSRQEILYLEAYTLLFLINSMISPNLLEAPNKLVRIQRRAQTRCARRFYSFVKGK